MAVRPALLLCFSALMHVFGLVWARTLSLVRILSTAQRIYFKFFGAPLPLHGAPVCAVRKD